MHSASDQTGNAVDRQQRTRRRTPWPLIGVAVAFVVVPFIAWYGTWFGRALSDDEIEKYLSDTEKTRHVQHALAEVERRIAKGDGAAKRWYSMIAALGDSPEKEVRLTAAWVMGADTRTEEFHHKLVKLVGDNEPVVRRNAALSLVGFGDARALPELRDMLKPFTIRATTAGTALTTLTEGERVNRESLLVRVKKNDGSEALQEVRSPLDARIDKALVKEGDRFQEGYELFILAPDPVAVGDALEGLNRLGTADDLAEIDRYARGVEGMPEYIKNRATRAAEAIRQRAGRAEGK